MSTAVHATRLLFVSRSFPADLERATYGVYIRMRMLLEAVCPLADVLHLVFFVDLRQASDEGVIERTRKALAEQWQINARVTLIAEAEASAPASAVAHYLAPALSAYRHPDFAGTAGVSQARAVADLLGSDVVGIFAHRLGSMWPMLVQEARWPPIALDLDDIEHRKLARMIHAMPLHAGKAAAYLAVPALLAAELRAVRRAGVTFVCSESDRRYLQRLAGRGRVEELPNSAVFPTTVSTAVPGENLLFIGSFTYAPNVDAAEHLVRSVWPRIRALRPSARLLIAGQRPERIPGSHAPPPGVTFLGFVADLEALYAGTRVVCCPIRVGGGTRIKIIEAAGYGRPVVSTRVGAEGLAFRAPHEIRIAVDDADFAAQCATLLADAELAGVIGRAARARVREAYDRAEIIAQARRHVASALGLAHTREAVA